MSSEEISKGFTPTHQAIADKENTVGFVALIDVLGFRELVSRDDELSQVRQYVDTVASLLEDDKYRELQFVLFSDNLVINTRNEERASFLTLIRACSDLYFSLARRQVAVRGAVAHGSFMRSPNTKQGVVVAGRPIVEADHYQHSQDWVGIMLAPSVIRRDNEKLQNECGTIPELQPGETESKWIERISLPLNLRKWTKIPFQSEDSLGRNYFTGFAVLPIRPEVTAATGVVSSLAVTLKDLEIMKAVAPNPSSQEKYSATSSFLQSAKEEWTLVASRPSLKRS
jgi:hypothetical protein